VLFLILVLDQNLEDLIMVKRWQSVSRPTGLFSSNVFISAMQEVIITNDGGITLHTLMFTHRLTSHYIYLVDHQTGAKQNYCFG